MNPEQEQPSVRRIVLPSGRSIEVVRFGESGHATRGLHVCPDCGSELVQPIDWSEAPEDCWNLALNCPNCDWYTEGLFTADQVRDTGWFVGQFIPAELGLRHQTDVELKWGIHPDGEKRPQPWANQNSTTISVLIEGALRVTFHVDGAQQEVTLRTKGDYVAFGPEVVHSWEALGDTIVLSVRFPSVEVGSRTAPA